MKLKQSYLLLAVLALAMNGCETAKIVCGHSQPPLPSFHAEGEGIPMRRVAVLPLYYDLQSLGSLQDMDVAFNAELTRTSLFEVVPISRAELETHFGQRQFSSVEVLPGDLLLRLRAAYGVDGVLFIDVTHYSPYRPIAIGVRAKLVDVNSGQIRWAFDHLFDSGLPATGDAAKRYYLSNNRKDNELPMDEGGAILQSPARFSKYAAYETFRSLKNVPQETESPKALAKSAD